MSFDDLIVRFFLVLNNIPLSRWNTLFIYLPTEKYLGCFQLLAIMNKGAINTSAQVVCVFVCVCVCVHKFWTHVDKYQEAQLLDLIVKIYLVVNKLPNCFPKWLHHFACPSTMTESSCCSTFLPAFGVASVLDFGYF